MRKWLLMLFVLACGCANGQVLISIILGDKLNSGKIEFGLDGGVSISDLPGIDARPKTSFNLGFYFDFKLKQPSWMVHTGVMVKSTFGARHIDVYPTGDAGLDEQFADGSIVRSLGYFNVPVLLKYRFKNPFYVEAGPMFGLMNGANDRFIADVNDREDLTYTVKVRKQYHPLDVGLLGGVGYRLMKGNGMNFGIRYYAGLVDVRIDDAGPREMNRALYVVVGIPIGVKAKEKE